MLRLLLVLLGRERAADSDSNGETDTAACPATGRDRRRAKDGLTEDRDNGDGAAAAVVYPRTTSLWIMVGWEDQWNIFPSCRCRATFFPPASDIEETIELAWLSPTKNYIECSSSNEQRWSTE